MTRSRFTTAKIRLVLIEHTQLSLPLFMVSTYSQLRRRTVELTHKNWVDAGWIYYTPFFDVYELCKHSRLGGGQKGHSEYAHTHTHAIIYYNNNSGNSRLARFKWVIDGPFVICEKRTTNVKNTSGSRRSLFLLWSVRKVDGRIPIFVLWWTWIIAMITHREFR